MERLHPEPLGDAAFDFAADVLAQHAPLRVQHRRRPAARPAVRQAGNAPRAGETKSCGLPDAQQFSDLFQADVDRPTLGLVITDAEFFADARYKRRVFLEQPQSLGIAKASIFRKRVVHICGLIVVICLRLSTVFLEEFWEANHPPGAMKSKKGEVTNIRPFVGDMDTGFTNNGATAIRSISSSSMASSRAGTSARGADGRRNCT
jgi:hypothetical protein